MRLTIYCLALLFCLFPYTQIIEFDSYTQPYALLFSIVATGAAFPIVRRSFPFGDLVALISLAALGTITFLINCMPSPSPQELKYLLIYISPFFFAAASFGISMEYPKIADRIIVFAAVMWVTVGLIQTLVDPSFASQFVGGFSEAAEIVVDSGRGTLGLAPEPTHFGFHMIILATAAILVGGRNWLSFACLATAVLIARSSSAVLALALGALIYLVIFGGKARLLVLLVIPVYFVLGALIDANALSEKIRLVILLKEFYNDPFYLLTSDASANARLGGIYVGAKQIVDQLFLPAGMAEQTWLDLTGPAMAKNPWLIMLSQAGVPSGILIIVFQLGFLALIPLGYILGRMLSKLPSHYETFLLCAVIFVFFSQYMISTPGFGMIYGMIVARKVLADKVKAARPTITRTAIPYRAAVA